MERKNSGIASEQDGLEKFEQLMERGRMLHSQAVYDAFARMARKAARSTRRVAAVPLEAGN